MRAALASAIAQAHAINRLAPASGAPGGVDVVIDALGGPLTGQAVAGLAHGGRVMGLGYAAGTETTMRVTDLVWKLAPGPGGR
jgi:NADPH:quinone reductase-like Zn-dependent oxidoreductase